MTPHAKVYFDHFDYKVQEEVMCECCTRPAVDIHHILGRIGKDANNIKNLIALCRKHHEMAHLEKISKGELQFIHNNVLVGNIKVFIQ